MCAEQLMSGDRKCSASAGISVVCGYRFAELYFAFTNRLLIVVNNNNNNVTGKLHLKPLFRPTYVSKSRICNRTNYRATLYASAVFAVAVCPSVCPSQGRVLSKQMNESSWFLAWSLPSTYPTLRFKEIWVSQKIMVLPSGTLSQTADIENFATASRSRCQQNS